MSEQRALVAVDRHGEVAELRRADEWDQERIEFVRRNFCGGAPDGQAAAFIGICKRRGLAPEERQVYLVERGRGNWIIQTGIDGYRLIAERTGRYAGSDDPVYDGEDRPQPGKATVTVWKLVDGVRYPFTASARWREYAPEPPTNVWKGKPYLMLAKCAEALALRKAFPAELSALYTAEELDQVDPPTAPPAPAARSSPRPLPQPQPEPRRPSQPRPLAAQPQPEPEPAGAASDDPDAPGSILSTQMRRLMAVTRDLPVADEPAREVRNAVQEKALRDAMARLRGGRGVASRKDLSRAEATALIDELGALRRDLDEAGEGLDPSEALAAPAEDAEEAGPATTGRGGLPLVDAEPVERAGEAGADAWTR